MIAQTITTYDGHTYKPGEEIPDLGSMVCTEVNGRIRSYSGLSSDFPKLEAASKTDKYKDLATDSDAYLIDTVEFYIYNASDRTWYKQG